jgi:hypothetical protein
MSHKNGGACGSQARWLRCGVLSSNTAPLYTLALLLSTEASSAREKWPDCAAGIFGHHILGETPYGKRRLDLA